MADDKKNLIKFADVMLKSTVAFFILYIYKTFAGIVFKWVIAYYVISLIGLFVSVISLKEIKDKLSKTR